jgi:hypothetical protein
MTNEHDTLKYVVDAASFFTVIGTITSMLPAVAALFTIIWTSIRIYETDTVQRLLGNKD